MSAKPNRNVRLQVVIHQGVLTIRIGVNTLANAAVFAPWANPWSDEHGDYVRTFAVTNPADFAKDVKRALESEREDGSSILTDLLDKACESALDDGSEGCEYEQVIPVRQFSPLETWAK